MGSRAEALKTRVWTGALLAIMMATAACATDEASSPGDVAAAEVPGAKPEGGGAIAPIGDEADAGVDPDAPVCAEDKVHLRGAFGKAEFTVDVARTPEERAKGLMFVEKMPMRQGMLFAFPSERPLSFWMKNTLIPLDMLYIDQDGIVVDIHENAVPGDLTGIPSSEPAQYVLEINGGMSRLLGLAPGVELAHPEIAQAKWRCR